MANDPKFVRLPERLLSGNWTDLETGWGIAGLDVKEFPDDEDEARAVRAALRAQLLEPATQSHYNVVQKGTQRVGDLARASVPAEGALGTAVPWNEANIAKLAKKVHKELVRKRFEEEDGEEEAASSDYHSATKPELVAEINRRNAERDADNQLDVSGTKDDLVTRLEDDDRVSV